MTGLRPLGAQLWPPGLARPLRGRYESPEWTMQIQARRFRTGYADVVLSQWRGRDHTFAPELLAELQLAKETTVAMRWALHVAATSAYHLAAGEVS